MLVYIVPALFMQSLSRSLC